MALCGFIELCIAPLSNSAGISTVARPQIVTLSLAIYFFLKAQFLESSDLMRLSAFIKTQ